MSSDDGIYMAKFPNGDIRVGYASDSVICELETYAPRERRDQIVATFGQSLNYQTQGEAFIYALELQKSWGGTEYGICQLTFMDDFGVIGEEIDEWDNSHHEV